MLVASFLMAFTLMYFDAKIVFLPKFQANQPEIVDSSLGASAIFYFHVSIFEKQN